MLTYVFELIKRQLFATIAILKDFLLGFCAENNTVIRCLQRIKSKLAQVSQQAFIQDIAQALISALQR
jgi:hypothetical protein